MGSLIEHLAAPPLERGEALVEIATRHSLVAEDGYLHSTLGTSRDGRLILRTAHGSAGDLGAAQKRSGAERALLLDNGGSCGYCLWKAPLAIPGYLGQGSYFRPRGHAVLVAELARAFVEKPFRR